MKEYNGFYLGIVVQNNDPDKRGRVKVFVPHLSTTVYDKWNLPAQDIKFKFTDNPDFVEILPELKKVLPWAECASPLFGGNASGRYNAMLQKGSTSDSNTWEGDEPKEGFRPAQNYTGDLADAFETSGKTKNKYSNPFGKAYAASNYSNLARGLFTIPNVGAHVWVFFANGNPNTPVYFAAAHGKQDWSQIYDITDDDKTSLDYPGAYENISENEGGKLDDKAKRFKSKVVWNSNKHAMEMVDTDGREILKMTHYSGSFKEFTNFANIELATTNDQKLVMQDQFLTVNHNQSNFIGGDQESIIYGDQYLTVGSADVTDVESAVKIMKEIHDYKRLFDIMRASNGSAPNDVSPYQARAGTYAPCPVCKSLPYAPDLENLIVQNKYHYIYIPLHLGNTAMSIFMELPIKIPFLSLQLGSFLSTIGRVGYYKGNICDVCKGSGFSPSTENGFWLPDPKKQALKALLVAKAPELAAAEEKLGEGGDQVINVIKNKVETVGTVMNDMPSFRVDPIGKLRIDGVHVALEGVYETLKPSPHVEYVDVDDVPGGDYNLTVTNKFKLLVGAKGINMKTFGPIDIYGTIVNMTGEQINISSQNEVFIDGGERFSIRARKIALIPFEHNPVVVEGQMHVTRNAIIGGGMHVEGELSMLHMTAPYEYHETEPATSTTNPGGLEGHSHSIPPHTHVFKMIPVTFKSAQAAVRDQIRAKGINSTTVQAAAAPFETFKIDIEGSPAQAALMPLVEEYAETILASKGCKNTGLITVKEKPAENSEGVRQFIFKFNYATLKAGAWLDQENFARITPAGPFEVHIKYDNVNGVPLPESIRHRFIR